MDAPGAGVHSPPHRHPTQVEEYEILDGRLEVNIAGEWRMLEKGDFIAVPVNTDHTFRGPPGQTVRVCNFHRPGGHFDVFIEKQYRFVTSSRSRV